MTHTGCQRYYSCTASWGAVLEPRHVQPLSLPFPQLAAPRQPAAPPRKKHLSHLASGASLLPEAHWATLLLRQSCADAQLLAPAPLRQLRGCHASQGWCHTWTLGHLAPPSASVHSTWCPLSSSQWARRDVASRSRRASFSREALTFPAAKLPQPLPPPRQPQGSAR